LPNLVEKTNQLYVLPSLSNVIQQLQAMIYE